MSSVHPMIALLDNSVAASLRLAGTEMTNVVVLRDCGRNVPLAIAVTTSACKRFLEAQSQQFWDALCNGESMQLPESFMRDVVVPSKVRAAIVEAYHQLGRRLQMPAPLIAVRSSSVCEDQAAGSLEGRCQTDSCVRGETAVIRAVVGLWLSTLAPRVTTCARPHNLEAEPSRKAVISKQQVDAVILGGGGGVLEVTLPACRALGWYPTVVQTTFGTGGSSRRIEQFLRPKLGGIPSPGNLSAAFQRVLMTRALDEAFEYRVAENDPRCLTDIIHAELADPACMSRGNSELVWRLQDRLVSFARDWDRAVRKAGPLNGFPLAGNSIRNLIVLWHWLMHAGDHNPWRQLDQPGMCDLLAALHRWLEIDDAVVLPISVDPGTLVARYRDPVRLDVLPRLGLDRHSVGTDHRLVIGQHAINLLGHSTIVDFDVLGERLDQQSFKPRPRVFKPALQALQQGKRIIVGGGSFFTSLLACLGVGEVLETMISRPDVPRVLVLNPYHLDQTRGLGVLDFVQAVERMANRVVSEQCTQTLAGPVTFEQLFSDIVVAAQTNDSHLSRLLWQNGQGEARGSILLEPDEAKQLESRGVQVHCGDYTIPQRKRLKRPGNHFIEIAGYDPLRIAPVLAAL